MIYWIEYTTETGTDAINCSASTLAEMILSLQQDDHEIVKVVRELDLCT